MRGRVKVKHLPWSFREAFVTIARQWPTIYIYIYIHTPLGFFSFVAQELGHGNNTDSYCRRYAKEARERFDEGWNSHH